MAQTAPAKKMLIMNILDILKRYTDEEHKLSQKQIIELLQSDYDMTADRKTVARNLSNLMAAGYPIECRDDVARTYINKQGKKETSYILSDFYLERDFTDAELRLLIDSLLFSKHIPYSQCKELVEKLEGLSNRYFKPRVRFISTFPETKPANLQLFYTIEIIDEAIAMGKQVAFTYNKYGIDKKLHPRREQEYIVNPYQMAATNGRYYLIGNYDKYDYLANYRIDRITNIRLLDSPIKPKEQVEGGKQFSLPKHMAEHLYMFSGESVPVTFRMKKGILNDVIDWFGTDITFSEETEEEVTARVTVNWSAMRHWALQYCRHVRVLSPSDLAHTVKEDLQNALNRYQS
ncbi:MAG: WYL domain-containing protein [Ruminococcaceae bacterium]|nr:WYL domain-containing protein [Oscillospiraceae bacterium]